MALTDEAHALIRSHLEKNSIALELAIDATCGKGRDTLFLATLGFRAVLAFDIQTSAIDQTKSVLANRRDLECKVTLIRDSHETMSSHIKTEHSLRAQCIMFNLGYLPSADKSISTEAASTISALTSSLNILSPDGIISIMVYPGHLAGAEEYRAIKSWLSTLDESWCHAKYDGAVPTDTSPILYLLHRRAE